MDARLPQRFWSKVDTTGECWTWTAGRFGNGYPAFCVNGKNRPAHRVAYEQLVGPIPVGLVIDHLCRNPSCVNPAHLEAVAQRENLRRGQGYAGRNARKTHCPRGHEFTPKNTRLYKTSRICRQCAKASVRRRQQAGYWKSRTNSKG